MTDYLKMYVRDKGRCVVCGRLIPLGSRARKYCGSKCRKNGKKETK